MYIQTGYHAVFFHSDKLQVTSCQRTYFLEHAPFGHSRQWKQAVKKTLTCHHFAAFSHTVNETVLNRAHHHLLNSGELVSKEFLIYTSSRAEATSPLIWSCVCGHLANASLLALFKVKGYIWFLSSSMFNHVHQLVS